MYDSEKGTLLGFLNTCISIFFIFRISLCICTWAAHCFLCQFSIFLLDFFLSKNNTGVEKIQTLEPLTNYSHFYT